jgi:Fur family ferric uptake transcriptional regulator
MNNTERILKEHAVRVTPVRMDILDLFLEADHQALSNSDIEHRFESIDRITLYRTLKSFEQNGIIHQVNDGSGTAKYAICSGACSHDHHEDNHAHFHCEKCDKTICLDGQVHTKVETPEGYSVKGIDVVLKGVCDKCIS